VSGGTRVHISVDGGLSWLGKSKDNNKVRQMSGRKEGRKEGRAVGSVS